jgi:hypothetical protein
LAGKALRGACDVGMVNPFLDRPVSANGQEKVATDISSERWAEPFPRTGGRRSASSKLLRRLGSCKGNEIGKDLRRRPAVFVPGGRRRRSVAQPASGVA